ncbi:Organ specific protein [Corchorus olitorius]|uniref:Organ specific protein n=1 Tax=Corchorus olitorius TaxID=93759 RepID=A0A1R3JBE3_9ROSI|nr:Organ specific protein [Corchorus olitorius]
MKTLILAIFLFCFLLLSANLNYARKEPGEYYWKSVMKDQPMPEAIKGLFHDQDPASSSSALGSDKKMNTFVKDFDSRHSVIIYHTSPVSEKEESKHSVKDLKP